MSAIKFGTDGWRAKMGDEFTFRNVRVFAQAYANYLKKKKKPREISVIVNYDTRFLSHRFAAETAKIFSLNGMRTYIPNRDVPLAPIALSLVDNKLDGAINFTASFNTPIYNGIKVFTSKGVSALPSETRQIEDEIEAIDGTFVFKPQYADDDLITHIDVKTGYIKYLEHIIDFDMIRQSGMKVIVDNLNGASREYMDYILSENGLDILAIRSFPYSAFENIVSSCTQGNLKDLARLVVERKADLGLATDIDGDRFGIIDSKGKLLDSNTIIPPLIEYLIKVRKMDGGIVQSFSTTNNIRRVADYYMREVFVTPVGFKYLANVLLHKKAFIAVESTNGASLNRKIVIKDGILFNLLVAEMLAYHKLDMDEVLSSFYTRFPRLYNAEAAIKRTLYTETRFNDLLAAKKIDFSDFQLRKREYIDGIKFIFDDAWLLIRYSGTSRVIRLYAEATSLKGARSLIKSGRALIE